MIKTQNVVSDCFSNILNSNGNGNGNGRSKPFKLDEDFLNGFRSKKAKFGFNGLGEFVFYRTYSRIKPDGTKESFVDTLQRAVEGTYEIQRQHCYRQHIPWTRAKAQVSAQEMFERMWDFKFLPPGRGLWAMGTKFMWERGSAALNNCGFCSTENIDKDPAEPFHFMIDMSMLGVGIGFDTRGAGKLSIYKPRDLVTTFVIPDSREGWADSAKHLIESYTIHPEKGRIKFDYSLVRPAGTPINGFGGQASGPGILERLHNMLDEMLDNIAVREDNTLSSVDIVDMMNMIGKCVVAGNVRRCLPRGTLVHLKRGLTPIESVQVGDLVLTSDGYHPVAENVSQGVQRVITIKSQMGQFRCTARHRIAVMTGIGEYEWKRARELRPGDRLVFVDGIVQGTGTVLPGYNNPTRGRALIVPGLTVDAAWFLGAIQGDGYVYPGRLYRNRKHHGASVTVPVNRDEYHDQIAEKVATGFSAFGFDNQKDQPSQDNCHRIRVVSRQLSQYLYKHIKQARTPLDVPECIRLACPEIRGAYLAGLLDSDRSTKNRPTTLISSVYCDFLRQVQAVYSSLGIPTKLKLRKEATGTEQAKWEISLVGDFAIDKFNRLVQPHAVKEMRAMAHASGYDFGYPTAWVNREVVDYGRSWSPQQSQMTYQRAVLCEAQTNNLIPVEVHEVIDEGIEADTYDLSVPDRNEFVAQGLLVHNTAEIAFGDPDDVDYREMKNPLGALFPEERPDFSKVTNALFLAERYEAAVDDFQGCGIDGIRLSKAIELWNALNSHRWASNNAIFAKVGMDYSDVAASTAENGEPGYLWLDNIRNFGRMVDGPQPGIDRRAMGSNPCVEQTLESNELCCLVETFPAHHEDAADYLRTLKFAYLYAKTVTLLPTHNAKTNAVMQRNRRIGLSQSGIIQAFKKFGYRQVLSDFCDRGYKVVSQWDDIYSEWLCVGRSVKKTSVKPSGTVSLVAGTTAGIHYTIAPTRAYWRNVRVANSDPLLDVLKEAGYHIEPDGKDDRTSVVRFGVHVPDVETVGEVSIWEQVKNASDYQRYWADNQVSCTVQFREEEGPIIAKVLSSFEDHLKGISFLPLEGHGYHQAPYEPATPEEVESYLARLGELDFSHCLTEDVEATKFCDGDKCAV